MIITISGMPGSGKTTVGRILAEKLGFNFYSIGGMRREIARKRGILLSKLNEIGESEEWTDKEVDDYQRELGKNEDNFVVEGRTGFFLIPDSIKVFLEVGFRKGVKRIFDEVGNDSERRNEGAFRTLEEAEKSIKKRMESDKKRYRKYYDVDVFDGSQYDIVLDTSDISPEDVADKIIEIVKKGSSG